MCLFYDTFESTMGRVTVVASHDGLCAVYGGNQDAMARMKKDFKGATFEHSSSKVKKYTDQLKNFLNGKTGDFDVEFDIEGTPFQKKVWKVIAAIPYGRTISYTELARKAGNPKAIRAAASACGSNPVPLIVPCHRVVRTDGTLGGFGLGLPMKKQLLEMEKRGAQSSRAAA